jgi:LuxR family maltose regulon positive regulatory protein
MVAPLLSTKLFVPTVRAQLVSRPRLVGRLNAAFEHALTLISAPAGFGKTTLLSEWVDYCGRPVAWLSLDESENDATGFLAYLVSALQKINARIGLDLIGSASVSQPSQMEEILTALINQIGVLSNDFTLILDDYQAIRAQPIHDGLTFLLDHLPGNLHLVIATRTDPPLPIARLRGQGQLVELRATDLRFTLPESTEFLNHCMGLDLNADEIAVLTSRTEGWIVGLQMAAVSIRDRGDVSGFVRGFAGTHRYILDYLLEEVLQSQPADIQDFLLQTSILESLSASLCDQLLGENPLGDGHNGSSRSTSSLFPATSRSQEILEFLESANLFILPLDSDRHWYRYHHLFRDLLQQGLRWVYPDRIRVLHRRACTWYARNGRLALAVEHALAAEDFERAADLIEQAAEQILMRSEFATLLNWLGALPDTLLNSRPLLCIYLALASLPGKHSLEAVEALLHVALEADPNGSVAGYVAMVRALIAAYQVDAHRSVELSQRALDLLPEDNLFSRSNIAGYLGLAHLCSGDIEAAEQALGESIRMAKEAGNLTAAVLARCHLAEVRIVQGRLFDAQSFYRHALELSADGNGRPLPVAGLALMGLGWLLYQWNDLEDASRSLAEGIDLVHRWSETGASQGYRTLAYVKHAQGDNQGACESMRTALDLAIQFDVMKIDDRYTAAHQAKLWVLQENISAARRWVDQSGLANRNELGELEDETSQSCIYLGLFESLILARLHLLQSRPNEALEILERLLQKVGKSGWVLFVVEILALESLAFQAKNDLEQALARLADALCLAEPGSFVRIFVELGKPMEELLELAATQGLQLGYVKELLNAFQDGKKGRAQKITSTLRTSAPDTSPSLIEPLSERELDVLDLLAGGLTNKNIAEKLVIAVETVKTHLKHIYSKLGVHNRTQAVSRAQDLGLL